MEKVFIVLLEYPDCFYKKGVVLSKIKGLGLAKVYKNHKSDKDKGLGLYYLRKYPSFFMETNMVVNR